MGTVFIVVIGCHIPFIFFSGKDCFFNLVNEIAQKTISRSLNYKLMQITMKNDNESPSRLSDITKLPSYEEL